MVFAGKCTHGLRARRCALRRRLGFPVEFQDAHKVRTQPQIALEAFELLNSWVVGHGDPFKQRRFM